MKEEIAATDDDFRRGHVVPEAPPSRFYVNLTETCNIRCTHCITHAPTRTEDGSGRSMSREVLDALAPHLAHAIYVGLTHAGEPITAPMMTPLLEVLAAARANRPTTVHVLTNGLALTERRFEELTALGVTSWSFSVDGMSADSHDVVRIGSKIDRLLERIRRLATVRDERHPHVRFGIAWTMTSKNLAELDALVDFAAEVGVSWVKVEEMFPVNDAGLGLEVPVAERRTAVESAARRAEAAGLPFLDHTSSPDVWKCRLEDDARMARFSRVDDFANGFEINPCRLPYELVCVEPNGDVKPTSFDGPVAGNLLQTDLLALWRTGAFVVARTTSMLTRLCGRDRPTCGTDPGLITLA